VLGIAQRINTVKFEPDIRFKRQSKPLPASIKTLADWIQFERTGKNLTAGHLAGKMGIAAAVVRSWEDGSGQPNEQQMEILEKYFGTALPKEVVC
jgi:ribosome-binding protein aMBF1 (putative translation factor)